MTGAGRAAVAAATILAAAIAGTYAACGGDPVDLVEPPAAAVAPAPAPVAAPSGDQFVGVLTARRTAVIAVEVEDARVEEILVHMGDQVRQDQPLARLDDRAIRQRLAAAVAEAEAARAAQRGAALDLDDARHKLALERRLYKSGVTAREQVRSAQVAIGRAQSSLSQAAATSRAAAAAATDLERQVATTVLTAPIAGVVTALRAREGELLAPGTAVMRILDPTELRLRFAVPADRASRVAVGTRVELVLADSDQAIAGVVQHIAPELEPPLRLVLAEAAIEPGAASVPAAQAGSVGKVRLIE